MIKLILTDLDGTLLNDEKHIPERNKIALKKAMDKGIHVSIATGRNYYSAKKYVEELGLDVPVVFQNGAFIYMPFENKILYETPLHSDIAKQLIDFARDEGLDYILFSDFFDEKDMYMDKEHQGGYVKYLQQNSWRINKVDDVKKYILEDTVAEVVLMGKEDKILKVVEILRRKYQGKFSVVKNNVIDGWAFFEFFGKGASKEDALRFLLDYFGVSENETMFLGDSYNDIGIMKLVGFPVAMENAFEEVKKVAKFVTLSNNDGGVGFAVEKFVL
ncbi:hydrolase Cof [Thermosipho melanesiensis]|uniref:Cof-like hydrolase n=2 Tax=Thermosipho melanesiensis TaxID=46541 RepID=A6LL08_THEM4|nr:Cof-like hydrolase [Thermosipho melanesiensis BI429]APT73749.1 hydrolase Cof [Thermosipho melanesiensis]OOC35690.1 hydrolase Cof [Thermosipho melanesiensis]OOC38989.1 hydrolase Cof [Thermosipho melanesiensis]OOC39137.1 hydrolase Cof [Thermosipho melanesiensis]